MEKVHVWKIKKAFRNYLTVFNVVVQSAVDWAESNMAVDYGKVAVQTSPGNYKETQLCKVIDDNLTTLRWCNMVERVLEHYRFEKEKVKFIELHYFKGKGDIETCLKVGIARRTFYRWQNEILETAYNWAKELKLV